MAPPPATDFDGYGYYVNSAPPASPTALLSPTSRQRFLLQSPTRNMAVGIATGRHAADEEARAEVDVLNSRLEKTTQLTKKIQACLGRLDASGKSVREVAGPLNGETKRLQVLGNNVEAVLAAIERLRQPADSKNDEEQIIRLGPDKAGLANYLASIKRLNKALNDMQASNLRSTQSTISELQRLIKSGNSQLESTFDKLLRAETPRSIEPLHFVTKDKPFPMLSQENTMRLGLINSHVAGLTENGGANSAAPQDISIARIYEEIRGQYLSATLVNLAAASTNTAKKKDTNAIYRSGTNGIGMYTKSMQGLFLTEYDNICSIFTRDDWARVFQATCQPALVELGRTLRELNNHIKGHMNTDCFLAYEIVEIVSGLSNNLESRTGELKSSIAASLKPVRETAKASLGELLEDTKRRVNGLQTLPADGAPIPVVSETIQRLQSMVDFLRPISSIMVSLGDGGWKNATAMRGGVGDGIPSLASFQIGADGKEIFAHYCADTIEALMAALDSRARVLLQKKAVMGAFLANNVTIIERMIRTSDLAPLLESRMGIVDQWRKKATSFYTETAKDVSVHLFDVIHTNRSQRPTSGTGAVDSASIMKALSSKDKDNIKSKFLAFNQSFDEMVAKHKQFSMEKEVRQMFAKDMQNMIEPLYNRFWDRYHEIDKGKGKYVKYDKTAISAVFLSLY